MEVQLQHKCEKVYNILLQNRKINNVSEDKINWTWNLKNFITKYSFFLNDKKIIMGITKNFPLELPKFFLEDNINFNPHISRDGNICYIDKEDIFYDYRKEKEIIFASIDRVINVLNLTQEEKLTEFKKEFLTYWKGNESFDWDNKYSSLCDLQEDFKKIKIKKFTIKGSKLSTNILFDERELIEKYSHNLGLSKGTEENALIVQTSKFKYKLPKYSEKIDIKWIRDFIFSNCGKKVIKKLRKETNDSSYCRIFFIINNNEHNFILGFQFDKLGNKKNKKLPFFDKKFEGNIKLIDSSIINSNFLKKRGGVNFENKSVLLIGCGSVGGYVADGLVKMGVNKLTLVDNDTFEENNAFRHLLGMGAMYQDKVKALKHYLETTNLFVKITPLKNNILDLISENNQFFSEVDIVISCLGSMTIDNSLNDFFYKKNIPFIIAHNEAFNIGGHAFRITPPKRGCLACHFDNGKWDFSFIKHEKNQRFSKNITGCGSSFTPYGNLSSLRTSNLVLQLVNEYFEGDQTNVKLSWKGSSKELEENGFQTSESYHNYHNSIKQTFYKVSCKVCGVL